MSNRKIKVLIVDDSMSLRLLLSGIFSSAPDMEVCGMAEDPYEAREILKAKQPDVMTLDVEMPKMDGITFLRKVMSLNPIPTVMISTLTQKGSKTALEALELGAVDIVGKPSQKASELAEYTEEIIEKVRAAAYSDVGQKNPPSPPPSQSSLNTLQVKPAIRVDEVYPKKPNPLGYGKPLIAIGASTGGPAALATVLSGIPEGLPGIVVVQHMSSGFTTHFAKSLNEKCHITVVEAEDGMPIENSHAYIAPGGMHLAVKSAVDGGYVCKVFHADSVNRHRPSVDLLFRSVANSVGGNAIAVILTGMGNDGAECIKELKDMGAYTIAQDEASCIVYGMPREAVKAGGITDSVSLNSIANKIKGKLE